MQEYFSKLLTEQERAGSRNKSAKWGRRLKYDPDSDYEDQPRRVSMSRHAAHNYDSKSLTDVLSPLKGYLRKSVGRPWDDVYSELCQNLDRRSVSGLHVFSHLWQYVDRNTVMCNDGRVRAWASFGGYLSLPSDFYIHPYTGILCEVPDRGKRHHYIDRESQPVNEVKLDTGKSYLKIKGLWYYTEWTWIKLYKEQGGLWRPHRLQEYEDRVIHKKRQLGKKELKSLKLRNTVVVN